MCCTTYTFKRVKVAFGELFCSLEGSTASRCYSLYRTFIIEDGSEGESGYWATDEVTWEQGYVDDRHSCFWSQPTWKSRPFESRQLRRIKVEGRENAEGKEKAFSQTESSVSEKISEEDRDTLRKLGHWYSNSSEDSGSACRGTTAWHSSRCTAWMASVPLDLAHHPTHVVLDLGCTRSIGSRKAIRRFQ